MKMELSATVIPESDQREDATRGRLVDAPFPELLLRAYNEVFSGSVVLKTPQGGRYAVLFERGAPIRAHLAEEPPALIRGVMESQLPPEQVSLCEEHAQTHGVTMFGALDRLMLLPVRSVRTLFERYLAEQLQHLAHLPSKTLYRFFPGTNCFDGYPGVACRIEPLSTIVESLTSLPDLERYSDWLAPSKHEAIVLRDGHHPPDAELRGTLRLIVSRLRRNPDSLENLRLCRVASPAALVAAVYTLRSSGCTIERVGRSFSQRAEPQSGVVRRLAEPSPVPMGTVSPPMSSAFPVRDISRARTIRQMPAVGGPPAGPVTKPPPTEMRRRGESTAPPSQPQSPSAFSSLPPGSQSPSTQLRGVSERDVEAKALEAWMRAVDEKRHRPRALAIAEKASALFPENTRILFYRGCLESLAEQVGPAMYTLRRVLDLDPDYVEAQRELNRLQHQSSQRSSSSSSLFSRARRGG